MRRAINRTLAASLFILLLMAGLSACSANESGSEQSNASETASTNTAGVFTGTVAETMDAAGYTYVRLENDGESIWAAASATTVEVGQQLSVTLEMPMKDFASKALDRTFDTLYMVSSFGGNEGGSTAPAAPMMGSTGSGMAGHGGKPAGGTVEIGSITKPEGGYSVAELYEQSERLQGASVTLRGKVVKFNGGIMGRNWIHLQDGSGSADAGTHDLLVTTDAGAKVGDLVTVTGKVAVDQDFGAGYRYALLVEEAEIKVEGPSGESR